MKKFKTMIVAILTIVILNMTGCTSSTEDEFFKAIENSLIARQEQEVLDDSNKEELINIEIELLNEFKEKEFKDSTLNRLYQKYMDGLNKQIESLDLEFSEAQIKWQEGEVERLEVLNQIYSDYYKFDGYKNFKTIYIKPLKKEHERLEALKIIDADLQSQLDGVTFELSDDSNFFTNYVNNTPYDFDIEFHFTFYDNDRVRLAERTYNFEKIRSGEKNKLTFQYPSEMSDDIECKCDFSWYLNISIKSDDIDNNKNTTNNRGITTYEGTDVANYSSFSNIEATSESQGGYAGTTGKYLIDYEKKYEYIIQSDEKKRLSKYLNLIEKSGYKLSKNDGSSWWAFKGSDNSYELIVITCEEKSSTGNYELVIYMGK